jgi:hypothetical protein
MIQTEYTQVVLQHFGHDEMNVTIECFIMNNGTRLDVSFRTEVLPSETRTEEVLYRIAKDIIKKLGKYR